ncbi:hypothetical protein [Methanosarcina sp.]|uniref:Uncharacterized protein n=1 Tax=Methanosarcina spelaei TaxID=1036679 RepID=A0A2A2HTV4_9EURY|nr:hypothetical protein [Methanosarcina sp.]MDW5550073.1 hypothetical protein [Methanosarcina sp.]MDW5554027.1 hypothetical protein [Methanosarcina sp.]MDW5558468.1 hypothetical protein [Methanosarcina sp.]PAV12919.1 hypothetical protein ASJ81_04835 [Methanosarcina spelaei]
MKPAKIHAEIIGFLIFLISYILFFNVFLSVKGLGLSIYAPGTLIFALVGYWLGGILYDKYSKRK